MRKKNSKRPRYDASSGLPRANFSHFYKTIRDLKNQVNLLKGYLDYSPDLIVAGDPQGNIVEFNKGAEKLLGYKKEEVLGQPIQDLYFDPRDRKKIMRLVRGKGEVVDYECRLKSKSGQLIYISTTLSYLYDAKKQVVGTIGIAKDIRRRKQLEKELKRTAITDGLTGLFDRGYFNTRLKNAVEKSKEYGKRLSLIMIDLDGFKKYNDKHGHLAGDKVLHKIGRLILKSIDVNLVSAYRYGGDEFVIIVGERLQDLVEAIAETVVHKIDLNFGLVSLKRGRNGPAITASVGVARMKPKHKVYSFIKLADKLMYRAKKRGGNQVCLG
ncbi:MAG: diguanylate cyclase [Planctomycetes bacterium]|nr:diguanylate cyclase [Planctomycetota bacterium]